jgi:parallel beta-helix repeat protein
VITQAGLMAGIDRGLIQNRLDDFRFPALPDIERHGAVRVQPGDGIQQAIDRVSEAGGGTVRLASGKHYIEETIQLRSHVELAGVGPSSIITRRPAYKLKRLIYHNGGGLEDVVIRDLTIDGARSQADRGRDAWSWPHGIHILDGNGARNRRLLLYNVRIRRTSLGFHSKGTDDLVIARVNFHNNGCYEAFAHNFYLRRNKRVIIRDSYFTRSHTGNGVNLTSQTNIVLYQNEASNNHFRGFRAADTKNIVFDRNVAFGNGRFGIGTRSEGGGVTDYLLLDNYAFDNGASNYSLNSARGGFKQGNVESKQ